MKPFFMTKWLLHICRVVILAGFLFFTYSLQTHKPSAFHLPKQMDSDAEKSTYPGRYLYPIEHQISDVSKKNNSADPYLSPKNISWYPVNTEPSQKSDPNVRKARSEPLKATGIQKLTHIKRSRVGKPHRTLDPEPIPLTELIYEPGHRDNEVDEERICKNKGVDVKLLILITSRVSNKNARNAIRKTWKYYDFRQDIGIAFVLGRSNSKYDITNLDRENLMYADMIRGNSIDSYRNLTLKTISLLEWAHLHCPYAKYVLKTDDDVFINVPRLLSFIDKNKANRTIFGRRIDGARPVRNYSSKYCLSINDYPASTFPDFTTGPAYLITGDIVHELYKQSLHLLYLKLEDVFITGIVAEMLDIERLNVQKIYNLPYNLKTCNVRAWISYHMVEPHMQFKLWQKLFDGSVKVIPTFN